MNDFYRSYLARVNRAGLMLQRQGAACEFFTEDAPQASLIRVAGRGRWCIQQHACSGGQPKGDIEPGQCQSFHQPHDVSQLGCLTAHEAPPRRHIKK